MWWDAYEDDYIGYKREEAKMGKSYLVEGAKLRCICGSECSSLKVPEAHGYIADNKKKATCKDCIAEYNISHFGQCALNQEGKLAKDL